MPSDRQLRSGVRQPSQASGQARRGQQQQGDTGSDEDLDASFEGAELRQEAAGAMHHDGVEAQRVLRELQGNSMDVDPNRLQPRAAGGVGLFGSQAMPPMSGFRGLGTATPGPMTGSQRLGSWHQQWQQGPMHYGGGPMMGGQPPEWEAEGFYPAGAPAGAGDPGFAKAHVSVDLGLDRRC